MRAAGAEPLSSADALMSSLPGRMMFSRPAKPWSVSGQRSVSSAPRAITLGATATSFLARSAGGMCRVSLSIMLALTGCQIDTTPKRAVSSGGSSLGGLAVPERPDAQKLRLALLDEKGKGKGYAAYQLALDAAAGPIDPQIDLVLVEYYAARGVNLRDSAEAIAVRLKPRGHSPYVIGTGAWDGGLFVNVTCPQYYSCQIRFTHRHGLNLPVKDILTGIQ